MKYAVIVEARAERDIQLAAHWILGQSGSPANAIRWARSLRTKIATLKTNLERCPIDPDSEVYGEEVRGEFEGHAHFVKFEVSGALGPTASFCTCLALNRPSALDGVDSGMI
jgi:plasmid stabilization system protein ParE